MCSSTSLAADQVGSDILDALPTWAGGTGGGLTQCEQASAISSQTSALVTASAGTLTPEQAAQIAAGDVAAGMNVPTPDPGCSTFSDLSNQQFGSLAWWTCLQEVLKNYAIYLLIGLLVAGLLFAWAYGGFR